MTVETWDYYTHADGVVRLTRLRWLLLASGERRCLGPVGGSK